MLLLKNFNMDKNLITSLLIIVIVISTTVSILSFYQKEADPHADIIKLFSPLPNSLVSSPLSIEGIARGNWYFEASFPVYLYDSNGVEIAVTPAQAQGEWMTKDFVPFKAILNFSTPSTPAGTLILKKDNASGLPEFDDQVSIPIRFSQ